MKSFAVCICLLFILQNKYILFLYTSICLRPAKWEIRPDVGLEFYDSPHEYSDDSGLADILDGDEKLDSNYDDLLTTISDLNTLTLYNQLACPGALEKVVTDRQYRECLKLKQLVV